MKLEQYTSLEMLEVVDSGFNDAIQMNDEVTYKLLKEILLRTPKVVLACRIQLLSPLLEKIRYYDEALIETKSRSYKMGMGRMLLEALELRTVIDEGKYKVDLEFTESNIAYHGIPMTISPFLTMVCDIGNIHTDKYSYHTVRRLGTIIEHVRVPILNDENNDENIQMSYDWNNLIILNSEDATEIYNDIKNGIYITSITTYVGGHPSYMLSIEDIRKIADTLD